MFLQSRWIHSAKDFGSVQSSGAVQSARVEKQSHHSSSEDGGDVAENIPSYSPPSSTVLFISTILRLFARAKKKVLRAKHKHGVKFYSPVTFQKAWSPRPHHVSFSGTMWVDLTMVGVLYRLDEFFLAVANNTFEGFWVPYILFLAVYDAWEVGPLLQAEFRNHGISLVHSILFLLSWLLLALMGATIPFEKDTEDSFSSSNLSAVSTGEPILAIPWTPSSQAAFAYVKLGHTALRIIIYGDIMLKSKSKRARIAALPRLITYSCGVVPLIAAPILVAYSIDMVYVALCFLLSYILQNIVWNTIAHFDLCSMKSKAQVVRTNMPFVITRMKDWTQLQLGACVLGLITENLQTLAFTQNQLQLYVVLISSYFFLALLDLLSYSSDPRVFHDHALIIGGLHSFLWFEMFHVLGLSLLGVAVGLRYVFNHPPSVFNDKPNLVWLLVASSIAATMAILLQEANHKSNKKSLVGRKRIGSAKTLMSCTCIIAPALVLDGAYGDKSLFWVTVNLTISTLLVLVIHAYFGGFRKEVAKKTDFRLNGRILAALIARAWLLRARKTIAERELNRKLLEAETARLGLEGLIVVPITSSARDKSSGGGDSSNHPSTPTKAAEMVHSDRNLEAFSGSNDPPPVLSSASSTNALIRSGSFTTLMVAHDAEEKALIEEFEESVMESTEILRAIASFRKRSTKHSITFSQKVLIEDDEDLEGSEDEGEAVSVADKEKDIFNDELSEGDAEEEEEEIEPISKSSFSSRKHDQESHQPTIDEGEEEANVDVELGEVPTRKNESDINVSDFGGLESDNPTFSIHHQDSTSSSSLSILPALSDDSLAGQAYASSSRTTFVERVPEIQSAPILVSSSPTNVSNNASTRHVQFADDSASNTSVRHVRFADQPAISEDGSAMQGSQRDAQSGSFKLAPSASPSQLTAKGRNMYNYMRNTVAQSAPLTPKLGRKRKYNKPVTSRVLKKVLNEKFYERPRLLAAQDVFAEYTVSWSDLFLDIIYVGVVFRLGDYLAQGITRDFQLPNATREPLSRTIFLFASLFYAIFSLWWNKLGFSSKCGVTDVFHKVLDIFQALIVLICAANVTSPFDLSSINATARFVITGCLTFFHLTMLFLWSEIRMGKAASEIACSQRNIRRVWLSLISLGLAFLVCGLNGPLEVISIFWALSWLLPVIERFLTLNSVKADEKAPFLLRYVLHRLGDGALILLGEGVFQIIRAIGDLSSESFLVFALSFLNIAAARIALFAMDCFDEHAKKHVVLNSRFGHVFISFLRSLASPAIVGMGVALKLIVTDVSNNPLHSSTGACVDVAKYELLCVCSFFSLASFIGIYHLHRSFYFRRFRWRHFTVGFFLSTLFLIFPWIPCLPPLILTGGCFLVWAVAIFFHMVTDDLFSSKDEIGATKAAPKSENDQEVSRRATRVAEKGINKYLDE